MSNAFVYFSETGPSDYSLFEPLLFPLLFEANGAGGSHWTTQLIVGQGSTTQALITQRPIDAHPYVEAQTHRIAQPTLQYARGYVWLPLRDRFLRSSAALTVRETTRGTAFELPVVRESDFKPYLQLAGIPRDPRYRVTLRVYSLDEPNPFYPYDVEVFVAGLTTFIPRGRQELTLTRQRDEEPYFAIIPDLRSIALSNLGRPDLDRDSTLIIQVSGSPSRRIWAFVSVVDNETQQARIITPMK